MLSKKNLTLAVSLLAVLALLAGCTNTAAAGFPAAVPTVETRPAETQPKSERISREKALSIALSHAGVTDARDKEAEWDDGRWEVSFESEHTEYEYKISADGAILHREKEIHD